MRLPMLVISLLAAVSGGAAAQVANLVVAPAATVSGLTVTNAGTYTGRIGERAKAAPANCRRPAQSAPHPIGISSRNRPKSPARSAPSSASSFALTAIRLATA